MLLVWFYEALLFWFYEALLLYYYGPVYLCLVINEVVHAVVLPVIVQQMASIDLRRKWEVLPNVRDRFVQTPSGGDRIKIIPVGDEPCRKILPPVKHGQDYFTLALTRDIQPRDVISQRSVDFFAGKMKPKLTEFIESIEKSKSKDDFKVGIEARFGKVYWKLPNRAATWSPKTFSNLKQDLWHRSFNPEVKDCDVEHLLDGRECMVEITQIPALKFTVEGQDAGEYIAVIDEPQGTFVLDAVYSEPPRECRVKYDIALPGRKYDFRIGDCSAPMLLEREHSFPYQIARKITESLHRLPERKLSLILRGETEKSSWKVTFFRQRVQKQYPWKRDHSKKWILVVYEVDTFNVAQESCSVNIEKAPVNKEVDIPNFNFSRKEIELWSRKVFPRELSKTRTSEEILKYYGMESADSAPYVWTTEDMMKDFHEFVGATFEIATILDSSP